ncbi:HEAT repeat domain-containing protein [Limisphaera sp. VF-2]|uniref:HEAT repeat domain-containing protein n=1 Tax=Limisphaera sp. VF-2 TaxID=3400418 RepID=UPI00175B1122
MKTLPALLNLGLALWVAGCASAPPPRFATPPPREPHPKEAALLATLQSPDASLKDKADACRELARVGSTRAVPVLTALLTDTQLGHMALYALEPLPGEEANQALRQALSQAKGRALVGVITSLGVRRDADAVPLLQPFLSASDPDIRQAAALALGNIGTLPAVGALQSALVRADAHGRASLVKGLLRAAERRSSDGDRRTALNIYEQLRARADLPPPLLAAAWRGAILVRGSREVAVLQQAIESPELSVVHAGLRAAMEMPDPAVTRALADVLPRLQPERQLLVLETLAVRRDAQALPVLLRATNSLDRAVQLTAFRALGELGDPRAAGPLTSWIMDSDPERRELARAALASLPGAGVDRLILGMLDRSDPATQLAGLDLVARRRLAAALPRLLRLATAEEPAVRQAALKQVGELGAVHHWNALLDLIRKLSSPEDLATARDALVNLAERIGAGGPQTEAVLTTLHGASPAQATVLYHLLAQLGGTKPLQVTAAAARTGSPEQQTAAFQALLQWRTPDVADELLWFAEQAGDPRRRQDALRRYLQWASDPELPEDRRLAMCRQAHRIVQDTAGQKQLLAALSTIGQGEVIPLVRPLLDSPETREEACAAVVAVAERLRKRSENRALPEPVLQALDAVARMTSNAELAKRAQALRNPGT